MICQNCKTEVQDGLEKCPNCNSVLSEQAPKKKKSVVKRWWFWFLMAIATIVLIAIVSGGSGDSGGDKQGTNQGEQKVDVIEVSPEDLYAAYDDNEVAADQKYEGKTLKITGTIKSIGKDVLDQVYITFETDAVLGSVQCYFSEQSEIDKVASLHEGDTITIVGVCKGKSITSVSIKKCEIQ